MQNDVEQFLREGGIDFNNDFGFTLINQIDAYLEEDEESQFTRLMLQTEGSLFIDGHLVKCGIMCKSS